MKTSRDKLVYDKIRDFVPCREGIRWYQKYRHLTTLQLLHRASKSRKERRYLRWFFDTPALNSLRYFDGLPIKLTKTAWLHELKHAAISAGFLQSQKDWKI